MTVRLAHLADLHFGEEVPGVAEALAADIRAHAPHAVVVSGDLTRRAAPAELAAAFAFLATLGVPVLAVPGNHDIPARDIVARVLHPRRTWHAGSPRPSELRIHGAFVVGLDTVARGQWHLDWSAGAIPSHRRNRLADRLAAAAPIPSIVVCHHPLVHPPGLPGREPPRGTDQTQTLLSAMGVRAVLCGHLHRPDAKQLGEPWPIQLIAPSALSPRGGSPNGWNLVEVGPATLRARLRHLVAGTWRERVLISLCG